MLRRVIDIKAALIEEFGVAPVYGDFAEPEAVAGEVVVQVLASGLHQLVRGQASGLHYSSGGDLPQVPGADGVARLPDGRLAWFAGVRKPFGTMAERAPVRDQSWVVLPDGADPVQVAGQVNPAMSGWLALTTRAGFQPGQTVLVLGATGSSGRQAVQIAKHLGAERVIAAGRNRDALEHLRDLGADQVLALDQLEDVDPAVDIVLDYLWGAPMQTLMTALLQKRDDPSRPLTLVQVGSMAGRTAELPANALRSHNLRLIGSGLGSTPIPELLAETPKLIAEVAAGTFRADVRAVPLREVHQAWTAESAPGERLVLMP